MRYLLRAKLARDVELGLCTQDDFPLCKSYFVGYIGYDFDDNCITDLSYEDIYYNHLYFLTTNSYSKLGYSRISGVKIYVVEIYSDVEGILPSSPHCENKLDDVILFYSLTFEDAELQMKKFINNYTE